MTWFALYLAAGAVVGFLAGLLGIGGGMMLVPVLSALIGAQALSPSHTMHLALGTSMAAVVFTAISSTREHNRLGAVDWAIFKRLAPAMALGTLLSTFTAGFLPQRELALAFAAIVFASSVQTALDRKPKAERSLPGPLGLWIVGIVIGVIAGLVSAGGAFLSMPFMLWCGVPIRRAIGTGAALGIPVAVLGTIGYVASGFSAAELPQYSLGYVYLPMLLGIVATSVLTAPFGARFGQKLPVKTLKRVFALLLFLMAVRMAMKH